ncbi:MAG: integral rane protein [Thermoleophilia bacterium]|nr:integral rane protein [Thermoleophilia bacterium]MCZ4496516.1 integral rane protein [Thermoleophilia bacterium]
MGTAKAAEHDGSWRTELNDLTKAFAGAFLFGIPLLFTMEMWWIGEHLHRGRLSAFLALGLLVNAALAYFSGFRREGGMREALAEAVEALAIGAVAAVAMLFALGQLSTSGSLEGMLGMIAVQVVPLSLGASVANLVFSGNSGRSLEEDTPGDGSAQELLDDMLATFAGAVFFGFAIAPTEEIPMIAVGLQSPGALAAAIALTLLVSYLIVFASGFDPSHRASREAGGYFQHPLSETVAAYVVAMFASGLLLASFGQLDFADPPMWNLTKVVVLAIPATVGGAAGRVVV